jgi:hypothetical protein
MADVLSGYLLIPQARWRAAALGSLIAAAGLSAQPDGAAARSLPELAAQNQRLQQQVAQQQKIIDALQARMSALEERAAPPWPAAIAPAAAAAPSSLGGGDVAVRISAEVGLAYFQSGPDGPFANGEFRVDEARIYLEAPIWKNVFFHSETDLATRESSDNGLAFGEVYADIEEIHGPWNDDHLVNLRLGRIDLPFGEEYRTRNVMENPLISHSVADIWGMDGGAELYGSAGRLTYAGAVLNGGLNVGRNAHSSKSAAARLGYSGAKWGEVSVSAMRTGRLSASGDPLSAVWFGNGFFRSLGSGATKYWANLFEADAKARWAGGSVAGGVGQAQFNDNARTADFRRLSYFSAEAVQTLAGPFSGAVRYSGVRVPRGYYLAGQGAAGEYFFGDILTTRLQRLSAGVAYRFADPLVLKMEYSAEWGETIGSGNRNDANLFSSELGLKF